MTTSANSNHPSKPAAESGEPAPCPHCGSKLFRDSDHHGEWWGHKWNGCWNDVVQLHDKEDVEQWNRRPSPPTEPQGERAALDLEDLACKTWHAANKCATHHYAIGVVKDALKSVAGGERVVKEGELEAIAEEAAGSVLNCSGGRTELKAIILAALRAAAGKPMSDSQRRAMEPINDERNDPTDEQMGLK